MRAVLFCLAAVCLLPAAHADCAGSGMNYWPADGTVIAPSGLLFIEGHGMDQAMIRSIKRASLRSDTETVELILVATHAGALDLTQNVYRAERPLAMGATYTLWVTDDTHSWAPKYGGKSGIQWTVTAAPQVAWRGAPEALKGTYEGFGCGLVVY